MKIYIDNLKYKFECFEKEAKGKEQEFSETVAGLTKDKSRMDELICIKEGEIEKMRKENKEKSEKIREIEEK